jgi:hypothetical protein
MSDINEESNINESMKASADYAIIEAKERFRQVLDFSEESIAKLDIILGQIYQSFSSLPKDEVTNNLITDAAVLWGSYLGEYMRLKWGGTWISKGSDRLVSITNIELSPINLVYQKITSHPEYSVEIYLNETKKIIYSSVLYPQQSQYLSENIGQPPEQVSDKKFKIPVAIDRQLFFSLAGIAGILLVIATFIMVYVNMRPGHTSASGLVASATGSNTNIPIEKTLVTATYSSINSQDPTVTPLPTYTARPTLTLRPSFTPVLTYTQIATLLTPTATQKSHIPKPSLAARMTSTSAPTNPPSAPIPPTVIQPPPVAIVSCEIDPFTVPVGNSVSITFIAHFSSNSLGYGFTATGFNPQLPGQSGCDGVDTDGDGLAFCDGSSGILPDATTVSVTFSSSVGDCTASYSSR